MSRGARGGANKELDISSDGARSAGGPISALARQDRSSPRQPAGLLPVLRQRALRVHAVRARRDRRQAARVARARRDPRGAGSARGARSHQHASGPAPRPRAPRPEPALTFPKALIGAAAKAARRAAGVEPDGGAVTGAGARSSRQGPAGRPKVLAAGAQSSAGRAPKAPPVARRVQAGGGRQRQASSRSPRRRPPRAARAAHAVRGGGQGQVHAGAELVPRAREADAFAKRFAAQGAYVAVADSPGKAWRLQRARRQLRLAAGSGRREDRVREADQHHRVHRGPLS